MKPYIKYKIYEISMLGIPICWGLLFFYPTKIGLILLTLITCINAMALVVVCGEKYKFHKRIYEILGTPSEKEFRQKMRNYWNDFYADIQPK